MQLANVIGAVSARHRIPCLQNQNLLVVQLDDLSMVAADLAGAIPGDRVLVATGDAAARFCMEAPIDAAIVAIVDGV